MHFSHSDTHWLTKGRRAKVNFQERYVYLTERETGLESGDVRVSFTYKALD